MNTPAPKVLLVEDRESDRELFMAQLPADGPLQCEMLFARTFSSALATLSSTKVDLIVLDLNLPDSEGLETCRSVQSAAPDVPIVVLTGIDDEDVGVEAVAAGAQDYLIKGAYDQSLLARAIRFALQRAERGRAEKKHESDLTWDESIALRLDSLTPREREVLEVLVRGVPAKCIASKFAISVQTVAKHRSRILEKMGVNNDVELVRLVIAKGVRAE